ncbi:MAG: hypothetical protein ACLSVD_09315 [Eggerthellaceae bacterium]
MSRSKTTRTRPSATSTTDLVVDGLAVRVTRKRVKNLNLRVARTGERVELGAAVRE